MTAGHAHHGVDEPGDRIFTQLAPTRLGIGRRFGERDGRAHRPSPPVKTLDVSSGEASTPLPTSHVFASATASSVDCPRTGVASNPEAEFFDKLKDFRFTDGNAFDFRGERGRSVGGKDDTLANSNQRGDKGFITTYEVERTVAFVGKFKAASSSKLDSPPRRKG